MIPKKKEKISFRFSTEESGILYVQIPRTNLLERLSIKYLGQPAHHEVKLDELGSFVIQLCDGSYPVHVIEDRITEHFGCKAAPIRERLIAFLSILEANDWIEWREP
ncbi:PqqD family protein [Shimazuella soli]|uniref:PqqD family protein n=1 Tax=Shimazuella soli TaxID=1892854 RepID=UPI001F0DEBC1|nr:PqqD family protein [Shimazuella soli]